MLNNDSDIDTRPEVQELFSAIGRELPQLEKLLIRVSGDSCYTDGIYRFYHQSWKIRYLQDTIEEIVRKLGALLPQRKMNEWFLMIIGEGLSKDFGPLVIDHANKKWFSYSRPVVEAFLHAKYFLEMVVCSGKTLKYPPNALPSQWASVLYLYNLR